MQKLIDTGGNFLLIDTGGNFLVEKNKIHFMIKKCEICGNEVKATNFLFKKLGWKPSHLCNNHYEHIRIEKDKIYNNTPYYKKKEFLEYVKKGMTIGESYKKAGLTQDQGFAILEKNIREIPFIREKPV